ncbi:MAG: preprotein translocase subunit YajC [Christensenellales bacterium]|jgi:preprotein translocase YajC subunit
MINYILAAVDTSNIWTILPLLILMALLMVFPIFTQRKQKKKMQDMLSAIDVGTKIMTIGGFIGVISEIDKENDRYTVNFGTEENPINMVIIKGAVRSKLEK